TISGTQTNTAFRMRGKGVKPARGGMPGDLICKITVETPVNLTDHQKQLLEEFDVTLRGSGKQRHSPSSSSWLDGVKKFFESIGLS
ncbi:molecular chaperone DnaJ, partial [Achromatium sp. WMS2]